MSEQITHLAVFDDTRRLAMHADDGVLCEEIRNVLADRREAGRSGSLSRGNNTNLVPGVLKAREHWDERRGEEQFEREFAYVLGWHTHRAADRYFKPAFRETDPEYGDPGDRLAYQRVDGGGPKNLVKIYHDAVLYDRIYGAEGDPFRPGTMEVAMGSHPGSEAVDVTRVEGLFQQKWMAELVALYECACGDGERSSGERPSEECIGQVLDQRQTTSYLTRWFEEAFHEPDVRHLETYINEPNFYDESDPIVSLARSIQRDTSSPRDASPSRDPSPDVDFEAILENPGESQYAECLAKSYRYLRAASDLFTGENTPLETAEELAVAWIYEDEEPELHPTVDAAPPALSDLSLASVAAVEDVLRLAFLDDSLSERTREILTEDPEAAHAAAFADPGEWLAETLEESRSRFAYRNAYGFGKIAFASGVVAYDAVERRFADGGEAGEDGLSGEERLACEVAVLRARSSRANPDGADADELVDLFEGFLPRIRQRWHTLRADRHNYAPWSQRFFAWSDARPGRIRAYAEAYAAGEAAGADFYDADDPLIALARSTRDARTSPLPDLEEALADAAEQSTYARAMADALSGIRAVDAYAENEIDAEEFLSRIG